MIHFCSIFSSMLVSLLFALSIHSYGEFVAEIFVMYRITISDDRHSKSHCFRCETNYRTMCCYCIEYVRCVFSTCAGNNLKISKLCALTVISTKSVLSIGQTTPHIFYREVQQTQISPAFLILIHKFFNFAGLPIFHSYQVLL